MVRGSRESSPGCLAPEPPPHPGCNTARTGGFFPRRILEASRILRAFPRRMTTPITEDYASCLLGQQANQDRLSRCVKYPRARWCWSNTRKQRSEVPPSRRGLQRTHQEAAPPAGSLCGRKVSPGLNGSCRGRRSRDPRAGPTGLSIVSDPTHSRPPAQALGNECGRRGGRNGRPPDGAAPGPGCPHLSNSLQPWEVRLRPPTTSRSAWGSLSRIYQQEGCPRAPQKKSVPKGVTAQPARAEARGCWHLQSAGFLWEPRLTLARQKFLAKCQSWPRERRLGRRVWAPDSNLGTTDGVCVHVSMHGHVCVSMHVHEHVCVHKRECMCAGPCSLGERRGSGPWRQAAG